MFGARSILRNVPIVSTRFFSSVTKVSPANSAILTRFCPSPNTTTITKTCFNRHISEITEISILDKLPKDAFTVPEEPVQDNTIMLDSVLRKRRLKMKKHKLRKRRREQRSLMKRLGKI